MSKKTIHQTIVDGLHCKKIVGIETKEREKQIHQDILEFGGEKNNRNGVLELQLMEDELI